MNTTSKSNICIIGVGDAGSNITINVVKNLKSDYLLLKHRIKDGNHIDKTIGIKVSSTINPSIDLVRKAFFDIKDKILSRIGKYDSIVIIGNLASNFGSAILPVLTKVLKQELHREIVCFVILPFGFEREKIFRCGVSLSFLPKFVDSLIVLDNNAFLTNSPDFSINECYKISNMAIKDIIIQSLDKTFPCKFNLVASASSNTQSIKNAFIETMALLTEKVNSSSIKKCSLYIYNTSEKISTINNIVETTTNLLDESEQQVDIISEYDGVARCHILLGTNQDIVSWYDPLRYLIPKNNVLDFEPEIAIENSQLSRFRDIESSLIFDD